MTCTLIWKTFVKIYFGLPTTFRHLRPGTESHHARWGEVDEHASIPMALEIIRDAKTCEPCVEFEARKLAATARRAR